MQNISVGRYVPGNSVIHRLDPRVKLSINIIFIVLVFLSKSLLTEFVLFTPILFAFFLSGLRVRQLLVMFKPVIFISIFLFVINMFVMQHLDELYPLGLPAHMPNFEWSWKFLTINYPIIRQTALIGFRIYIMILITTLLTATTKPMALTKAIEDLLLPLKIIRFPVHIIAMIISIALRFIPTLLEEAQRIMKAQASRGVDFKNGNIKAKAKSMVTLIIPLFVSSFSKAEDLGNAMETRGYDPYEKRTRYREYPIRLIDVFTMLFIAGLIVFVTLYIHNVIPFPYWWDV